MWLFLLHLITFEQRNSMILRTIVVTSHWSFCVFEIFDRFLILDIDINSIFIMASSFLTSLEKFLKCSSMLSHILRNMEWVSEERMEGEAVAKTGDDKKNEKFRKCRIIKCKPKKKKRQVSVCKEVRSVWGNHEEKSARRIRWDHNKIQENKDD